MDKSPIQNKWHHFFKVIDANGDGILEEEDFLIIASRLSHLFDLKGRKSDEDSLKWEGKKLFENLIGEMQIEGKNSIDLDHWFSWLSEITFNGRESKVYQSFTLNICKEIFNACDQNSDGFISRPEFNEFYLVFNIPNPVSSHIFFSLDRNKDGVINRAELLDGIRHFFIDTEPNQFDIMFGEMN